MLQMILMLFAVPDIDKCMKNQRLCIFMIKKEGEKIGKYTYILWKHELKLSLNQSRKYDTLLLDLSLSFGLMVQRKQT